jgi:hypothetical protein
MVFQSTCEPRILYNAIEEITQLMEFETDRDVAREMMHVRMWERLHERGELRGWNPIRVQLVPP